MELTKEKCEYAFKSLYGVVIDYSADGYTQPRYLRDYYCCECDLIEQLIKEHFSNPPLKFKELKEGMWVWDDKEKTYLKIYIIEILSGVKFVHFDIKNLMTSVTEFEEGRFFAREVSDGN